MQTHTLHASLMSCLLKSSLITTKLSMMRRGVASTKAKTHPCYISVHVPQIPIALRLQVQLLRCMQKVKQQHCASSKEVQPNLREINQEKEEIKLPVGADTRILLTYVSISRLLGIGGRDSRRCQHLQRLSLFLEYGPR